MCDRCARLMKELGEAKSEISFLRMELECCIPYGYDDEGGSVFVFDDRPISPTINYEVKKQNDELYNENQELRKQLKGSGYAKYKEENRELRTINKKLKEENKVIREVLDKTIDDSKLALEYNAFKKKVKAYYITKSAYGRVKNERDTWKRRYEDLQEYSYNNGGGYASSVAIHQIKNLKEENKKLRTTIDKYERYGVPKSNFKGLW